MRFRLRLASVLALLACLAAPALAHATSTSYQIYQACQDGTLSSKTFTQQQLATALAHIQADVDEYTDCRAAIERAQLRGTSRTGSGGGSGSSGTGTGSGGGGATTGGGGTGGGTGATGTAGDSGAVSGTNDLVNPLAAATAAERQTYAKAVQQGAAPVSLDGRPISAGRLGGSTVNGLGDLPTPLLVILALLAVGGLGAAGFGTRRLVHARRPA